MKKKKKIPKQLPVWVVHYWNEDCADNLLSWTGRSRSKTSALKQANKFIRQFKIDVNVKSIVVNA